MGVPKKRKTKSATRQRRAHYSVLSKIQTARCKNCNSPVMPHEVCQVCGYYRGKQVLTTGISSTNKEASKASK